VHWCSKLNQLVAGSAGGALTVFYDAALSTKGALLSAARGPKRVARGQAVFLPPGEAAIFAPHAGAAFKEAAGPLWVERRKGARGGGGGGGGGGGEHPVWSKQTFTDHYLKAHPEALRRNLRAEDPQAVLQSYAGRSGGFTAAYRATQPASVLAATTLEEDTDLAARALKRPRQGGP